MTDLHHPELWERYLQGTKAFDLLYSRGDRCPSNPGGARCKCQKPLREICLYWIAINKLATEIGGSTAELVKKMG